MQTQVKLTFDRKGDHYLGTAEIPSRKGGRPLIFKTLIPMADIRDRINEFLDRQPAVGADPAVIGRMPLIENNVAKLQAKRRLGTAIRLRFGGRVRPYEIAGPAGHAVRLARVANRRADVGGIFKGIGKGFKAVGKGIGKGTVAAGKGIGKGAGAIVKNPITGALLTQVPGGAAAKAIIEAARGGSPGARQAVSDINALAAMGDVQAIQSKDALARAEGISPLMIAGVSAAIIGAVMLAKK